MKIRKYSKILLVVMMVAPWFSLPLMKKVDFKRFLPASLLIILVVRIVNFIAMKQRWWWWYVKIHPKLSGVFPFLWGPFFIGAIWILKFTYGHFFRFLIVNLVIDGFFSLFIVNWLQKLGVTSLVRMKRVHLLSIFTVEALLLYALQFFRDKMVSKRAAAEIKKDS